MSIKKIYIAGKVTGLPPQEVKDKFSTAQATIEKLGFEAVNPIEVVKDFDIPWDVAMRKCIKALADCDAILVLDDWNDSKVAKIEIRLAIVLELEIFYNKPDFMPVVDPNNKHYFII
ncbi:DUF4406 domain-containing protein [Flavobacterium gilvum]|uniref:DUF4406 domain-containing protein n=1 Tax=Flavobacterium gilvum TaxID=1492737 RepID=A0AAC9I4I5_9FLAO|nr:DUF4406 domain-containing protein [Flavobacterium gilvum]AOW09495.1 hypothetical protein EM308_08285 [Flavobacterium gilvum]KFC60001.1 hypothetical protein FEM08_11800 [Flavobacterium gilvum]